MQQHRTFYYSVVPATGSQAIRMLCSSPNADVYFHYWFRFQNAGLNMVLGA